MSDTRPTEKPSAATVAVRPLRAEDEPRWRELWAGYLDFYGHPLPDEVTASTWGRLLAGDDGLAAHVATDADGEVVGFVHSLSHAQTWASGPKLYLEDLYVDPSARGTGAGRALIAAVVDRADELGATQVHWITDADNVTAQRLYEAVASRSGFVRYEIDRP